MKQCTEACKSCPFLINDFYFAPEDLDRTVGEYYRQEKLHPCHSEPKNFCTGFLAFVKQNHEDGFKGYKMARFAIGIGILDPDRVPNLKVFSSIEELIENHQRRGMNLNK